MTSLVVKLGGHALDSLSPTSRVLVDLAVDVAELRAHETDVVVVHGGGPQIASLLADVGVESHFRDGLRVTDERTMRYVAMALSLVNLHVVTALNRAGLAGIGLSGPDGAVLSSTAGTAPGDHVGLSPKVHADVITSLWRAGFTPVMTSIAVSDDGELLNCNADTVAGAVAGALGSSALILLSDVDQLRRDPEDPSTALATVSGDTVRALIATGAARDGMRPKMTAALDALDGGAGKVVMANGTRRHALRDALTHAVPTTEVVR